MSSRFVSVLFSEPKIPQYDAGQGTLRRLPVSVLFSEPKIPQCSARCSATRGFRVSVLFSEPKIPQFGCRTRHPDARLRFQCSSASRKFLNLSQLVILRRFLRFSALQRAENSSIVARLGGDPEYYDRFSALQRAENSSICNGLVARNRR